MSTPDPLLLFADRLDPPDDPYLTQPGDWSRERAKAHLTVAQDSIASAVAEHRHVAVKSAHDLGKSYEAAQLSGWWVDVHPPGEALVISTAPSWAQVSGVLWQEISHVHRAAGLAGRILGTCEWKLGLGEGPDTLVGLGRKPADYDPTAFQGYHRRYLLVIIDEACGVPKTIWDAAESVATNEHARILAIGNPDDPASHFAEVCKPDSGWHVIHLDALRSPNFTAETMMEHPALRAYMIQHGIMPSDEYVPERVRDLLVSPQWVEERMKRWGVGSPLFTSKVRGDFPHVTTDTLIHPHWVELAKARELPQDHTDPRLGVDVARYGSDHTIIILRLGGYVRVVKDIPYGPTTTVAGEVQVIGNGRINTPVANVDDVGVGGGVTDILEEERYPCLPMIANAACTPTEVLPSGKPRFVNARSEWWWRMRDWFCGVSQTGEDGRLDIDPDDDELAAQLTNVKYKINRHGQIEVETKDQMRDRRLPSPDRADALAMALAPTPSYGPPVMDEMVTSDLLSASW